MKLQKEGILFFMRKKINSIKDNNIFFVFFFILVYFQLIGCEYTRVYNLVWNFSTILLNIFISLVVGAISCYLYSFSSKRENNKKYEKNDGEIHRYTFIIYWLIIFFVYVFV